MAEKTAEGIVSQRQKQSLISRLTGASDVGQDDQRIGCTTCGFPGHTARNCFNLVRIKKTKSGNTTARLLELSSTSSEDDDEQLIANLKRKKEIMLKIERNEELTKEEIKFLRQVEFREKSEKERKKKKKRRRRRRKKEEDSDDDDGDTKREKRDTRPVEKPGTSGKKMCEICLIEKCKYRCPKCRILYCAANNDFVCFRDHKDKGTCDDRIEKGLHIKPKSKEDDMDIKEKLALALKKRRRMRKSLRAIDD